HHPLEILKPQTKGPGKTWSFTATTRDKNKKTSDHSGPHTPDKEAINAKLTNNSLNFLKKEDQQRDNSRKCGLQ
ncbi:MAG: hypothetical protein ACK5VW_02835, partial [Holosporales bacterium]